MATLEPSVVLPAPIKTSGQKSMSVEAVAGPSPDSVAASGTVALTNVPKLGEPEAFFPANPAMSSELAQNKPVKQLASDDRTSSGGILRTISDVITDLRQKHQDKKRTRQQEAASGSPSQAKFRKSLETSLNSSAKAPSSPLKPSMSTGTPKRAGSGFGDKVPRMTCWGTSDQAVVEKKPSLAERYSAWKVKQQERRAARTARSPTLPTASKQEHAVVSKEAPVSAAPHISKPETAAEAGVIVTPLSE